MKTIQIPDELHSKLIKLAKEVKIQDNRSTANVFFQIEDVELEPAWDGRSDLEILYSSEYDRRFQIESDIKEIKEYCFEHYSKDENRSEKEAQTYFKGWDDESFCDYLVVELNFERLPYSEKKVYKNAFLTAKSCEQHLKANSYHYAKNARSFGSCAWRNPDIEIIHDLLSAIA